MAPVGTPKPVIDKLVSALQTAGKDAELVAKMNSWDATVYGPAQATPSAMRETMSSNVKLWTQLIKSAGLTPQ